MTQEQKELLIKDLCARLPYGVKIDNMGDPSMLVSINKKYRIIVEIVEVDDNASFNPTGLNVLEIEDAKPYLFPLSSMTEEQLYNNPIGFSQMLTIKADRDWENITINRRAYYKLVDWFNKNHFDYRGLIERGLAIDATVLNIY